MESEQRKSKQRNTEEERTEKQMEGRTAERGIEEKQTEEYCQWNREKGWSEGQTEERRIVGGKDVGTWKRYIFFIASTSASTYGSFVPHVALLIPLPLCCFR